ncbi:hypothetical protein [Enterococcus hirae]|uniref:hypothetical protein n=1 Tax=Enterococcus hirae TaxID=1354 RepID=UPI00136B8A21|nr:hypothetical protein [Enterococcus hirae]NAE18065.1 hypothetical protein [Enterococcus hirae]
MNGSWDVNEYPQDVPPAPPPLTWRELLQAALGPKASMDSPFPKALLALDDHVEAIRLALEFQVHGLSKLDETSTDLYFGLLDMIKDLRRQVSDLSMTVEQLKQSSARSRSRS